MRTPTGSEVAAVSAEIVAAFAATDGAKYFSYFAPDASFIFHPEPARLNSRAAYEAEWEKWVSSGWRVVACESSDPLVQVWPGGGVFSHTVNTTVETPDGEDSYVERESIVFAVQDDDSLLCVHEHLSPVQQ